MRKLLAAATALTVGLALTTGIRADDKGTDNKDKTDQSSSTQTQTIQGVVAGVTVEGETAVDYQSNKAVMLEAAYLTVVGKPGHDHYANTDHNRNAGDDQKAEATADKNENPNQAHASAHASSSGMSGRHNVYLVWLSPKTKVCESGKNGENKECARDKLEVGDRVEIKVTRRSESSSNSQGTPTEAMRKKHGRNRIYVCDASEITILSPAEGSQASAHGEASAGNSQDNDDKNKQNKQDNDDEKNKKDNDN